MTTTIYHNPRCSTSRSVLALLRAAGETPEVVDYLRAPPDRATIRRLAAAAGMGLRDAVRRKEPLHAALGLDRATDDQLLDAIAAHPVLLERPFVVTPRGTRLCRPPARVHEILPSAG